MITNEIDEPQNDLSMCRPGEVWRAMAPGKYGMEPAWADYLVLDGDRLATARELGYDCGQVIVLIAYGGRGGYGLIIDPDELCALMYATDLDALAANEPTVFMRIDADKALDRPIGPR